MNNRELLARLRAIIEELEQFEYWIGQAMTAQGSPRADVFREAAIQPRDTATQGWLAHQWKRRDGTVYGPPATQADAHINSPVRGGDDAQAQVSVPSGERRS